MNITKKLLFPLLLVATLFTSACFDDTPAKKSDNEPCVAASECESGSCDSTSHMCAPKVKVDVGQSCKENAECKTGFCDKTGTTHVCAYVPKGKECEESDQCDKSSNLVCKGTAGSRKCDDVGTNVTKGGLCIVSGDCATNLYCDTTTNKKSPVCADKKADWDKCTDKEECKSGMCDSTLGCLPKDGTVKQDGRCSQDSQCETSSPLYCDDTQKPNPSCKDQKAKTTSCEESNECQAKLVCKSKKCDDVGTNVAKDGLCRVSGDCATGLYCDTTTNKKSPVCADKKADWDKCTDKEECKSGMCDSTLGCLPKDHSVDKDGQCSQNSQCKTSSPLYCDATTEKCADKKDDWKPCTDNEECKSGMCDGTLGCLPKDGTVKQDGRCSQDSQCETASKLYCDETQKPNPLCKAQKAKTTSCEESNECQAKLVCKGTAGSKKCDDVGTNVAKGGLCRVSGDCDASANLYCDTTKKSPVCADKKAKDGVCMGNDECQSNNCDSATKKCK